MDFRKKRRGRVGTGVVLFFILACGSYVFGENLVNNGDFEAGNGAPSGWFVNGQKQALSYEKTGSKTGDKCIKIENAPGEVVIRQDNIPLVTSQQYKLSGYLKTDNFSGKGGLTVINEGWNWSCGNIKPDSSTNDWVYLEKVFTPGSSSNGRYQIVFYTVGNSGKIWVDGIKLEPTGGTVTPAPVKQTETVTIEGEKIVLSKGCYQLDPPPGWEGKAGEERKDDGDDLIDGDKKTSCDSTNLAGWNQRSAEATFDLGKEYLVDGVKVYYGHLLSSVSWSISSDSQNFTPFSKTDNSDSSDAYPQSKEFFIKIDKKARHVKLKFENTSGELQITEVEIYGKNPEQAKIDEERFKQEREEIKAITSKSLALNPGFELVDPNNANKPSFWKPLIHTEPGEASKPVLTYEKKGFLDDRCVSIFTPTNTDWGEWESEPIKLKSNTAYELTFWGKTNASGPVEIFFDGVDRYVTTIPRDWGRVSELFVTKPDTTESTIKLILYHRANQTVWFDHICLYPAEVNLEEPKDGSTVTDNSPLFGWSLPMSGKSSILQYSTSPQFIPDKTITITNLDKSSYIPTETLENGAWYWRVRVNTGEKSPELVSGSNAFLVSAKEGVDTTPPRILIMSPKNASGSKPEIKITYQDDKKGSGIDSKKVKIVLDGKDLTAKSKITENQLTFIPDSLSVGKHEAKISIVDKSGNTAEKIQPFYYYSEEPTVSIREDNVLMVEGKPFFPLGFYSPLPDAEDFKVFKENGFNCLSLYGLLTQSPERIKRWLDECEKAGLKMIPGGIETHQDNKETIAKKLGFVKDHPATIGWYVPDEPDGQGLDAKKMVQGKEWVNEITYKPCLTTFCVPSRFGDYADTVDIFWVDPYPYFTAGGGPKKALTVVSDWIEWGRKAVKDNKPVWIVPQIFNHHPPGERVPTYWELRAMTYLGIVSGAKGVIYYGFKPSYDHVSEHPGLWTGLKAMGKELSALSPALLSSDGSQKLIVESSLDIHYLIKEHKNKLYFFAVNGSDKEGKADFTLPDWNKEDILAVFPEARTVSLLSGKFSDNFKPYDVHIYTNDKNLPKVKTTEETDKESLTAENNWQDIQKNNIAFGYNGVKVIPSSEASYYGFNSCFVNDGVQKTHWAPKTGAPAWLEIEFKEESEINKIVVVSPYYPYFDQPGKIELKSYKVYTWYGNNWKEIVSVDNNDKVENVHQINPIKTKKVKIELIKGSGIAEVECWKK